MKHTHIHIETEGNAVLGVFIQKSQKKTQFVTAQTQVSNWSDIFLVF